MAINSARIAALLAALFTLALTGQAAASVDTYFIGDGHEGAATLSSSTALNYSAPLATSAAQGDISITTGPGQVGDAGRADQTQFEPGRLALIIQSSGSVGHTSGDQTAIDLSSGTIGRWELARIGSVSGALATSMTIGFTAPLATGFVAPGAQIVAVPEFTSVEVGPGAAWTANPWDGASGGVTALLATGTIALADPSSSIDADGAGFRGGILHNGDGSGCQQLDSGLGGGKGESFVGDLYPGDLATFSSRGNIATGGGGGDCSNAGGGGGGNGGRGGVGGQSYDGSRDVGGLGGASTEFSAFDRSIFGGGGGAGDENNDNGGVGGAGGGIVLIRARSLSGDGRVSASGAGGGFSANVDAGDGAGGGGAGGTVYARFAGDADCTSASATGGTGGDELSNSGVHGPGGGGGGGRVLVQAGGGDCPVDLQAGVAGTTPHGVDGSRGAGPASPNDPTSIGSSESFPGGGGLSQPSAAVVSPADGRRVAATIPTISGTSAMSSGTVLISLDDGVEQSVTTDPDGSWSFSPGAPLAEGPHTYSIRASYYGLTGPSGSTRSLVVDTTPPLITVAKSAPPAGVSPTFTFGSSEPLTTYECQIDGGASASCGSPFQAPTLPAGEHILAVRGTDAAGNIGTTAISFEVTAVTRGGGAITDPPANGDAPVMCTGLNGSQTAAPQIVLLDARLSKRTLRVRVSSDRAALAGGAVTAGGHTLGAFAGLGRAGLRTYKVKLRRTPAARKTLTARISIVSRAGARSSVTASLVTSRSGRAVADANAVPASGTADCGAARGAKQPKLTAIHPAKLRVGAAASKLGLRSSGWALALVRITQSNFTAATRYVILRPGRKLTTTARLADGRRLARGRATVSVDADRD
ncbi:MAG: hypothetical protein QM648_12200, partial [Solirubrobacterales bacterium]